jgi:hypothetical protein
MLVPFFLLTGIVIGFEFGQFYQVITRAIDSSRDPIVVNQLTFQVFIFLGIGEMISGPIISTLKGNITLQQYLNIYGLTVSALIVLTAMNVVWRSYSVCCLLGFLWYLHFLIIQGEASITSANLWGPWSYRPTGVRTC